MRRGFASIVFCVALLGGCHGEAARMTGQPAEPNMTGARDESFKRLALQPPYGSAPVDVLIVSLQRAVEKDPGKGALWVLLGRSWVRKARESSDPGFYLNARAAADAALAIDPGDAAALDLEGLVLLNEHRFEQARALAQSNVDAHPQDPAAFGTLSDALLELGRLDDAARSAQAMMDLKPNLPSYSRASYLRWLDGDVEGAKRIVRLAIDSGGGRREPEPRAWVMTQAALIFLHQGDYDGAEAGFDRTLEEMADYPPALVGKARVALARGDGPAAAQLLGRAYDASPLVETAWLLGDARTMAGDASLARDAYARVERAGKQVDPRTLALFWATRNEHPAEALALAEAEKAVRRDLYTEDTYAWALYRNRRMPEARAAIDRALAHGTPDARLLYHAGAIRIASADRTAGRKLVETALALEPGFDVTGAAEARRLLGDEKR
jgi:tetratricopeptide (TPR) repeat protein